jgi:hypothetical protein
MDIITCEEPWEEPWEPPWDGVQDLLLSVLRRAASKGGEKSSPGRFALSLSLLISET